MDLDYLYNAAQKGFGTFDLSEIEIVGNSIEKVKRKFKRAAGRKGFFSVFLLWLMESKERREEI